MARKSKPNEVIRGSVSIEIDSATHTGGYIVKDRWITVSTRYGSKGASVHEVPPGHLEIDSIARMLMHEIIGEASASGAHPMGQPLGTQIRPKA
jgi:hypothetical protein